MKFKTQAEWKRKHLKECSFVFRPADRSTLSRTFLCCYSLCTHRCMWSLCPLKMPTKGS